MEKGLFSRRVYEVVRRIPKGKVATYGQVAALAGAPRNARFVGYALHSNPEPGVIPCHRVVFRDGSLAPGFAFGGPETAASARRGRRCLHLSERYARTKRVRQDERLERRSFRTASRSRPLSVGRLVAFNPCQPLTPPTTFALSAVVG